MAFGVYGRYTTGSFPSLSALVTTVTDDNAMAVPAIMGESSMPKNG